MENYKINKKIEDSPILVSWKKGDNFFYLLFICFLVYNFIFPIRLNILPNSEFFLYLLIIILYLYRGFALDKVINHRLFIKTFSISLVLLILGTFSVIINSSSDILSITMPIKFVVNTSLAIALSLLIYDMFGSKSAIFIIKIIVLSSLIISISCILEYFFPNIRNFLFTIIDTSGNIDYDSSNRVHGFATGGGASLSYGLSVTSILSLVLFYYLKKTYWLILAVIIFIAVIFVGRTGVFVILPFVLFLILTKPKAKSILALPILIFIIINFYNSIDASYFEFIYRFGLEPIYNYIETGRMYSKTASSVFSERMYYLPKFWHLIYGAGFWRYPNYNYSLSDAGYMKILMSYGIIGFFLFFSWQLKLYIKAMKFYAKLFSVSGAFYFLFMSIFIVELKEEFFTHNYAFKIFILLISMQYTSIKSEYSIRPILGTVKGIFGLNKVSR